MPAADVVLTLSLCLRMGLAQLMAHPTLPVVFVGGDDCTVRILETNTGA